jgi:hypothetical protein
MLSDISSHHCIRWQIYKTHSRSAYQWNPCLSSPAPNLFCVIQTVVTISETVKSHTAVKHIVNIESTIFWEVTPCGLVQVYWCFTGMYRLHLQSQRIGWASIQYIPPKYQSTSTRLYNINSQKIALFIVTAVRPSKCLTTVKSLLSVVSVKTVLFCCWYHFHTKAPHNVVLTHYIIVHPTV